MLYPVKRIRRLKYLNPLELVRLVWPPAHPGHLWLWHLKVHLENITRRRPGFVLFGEAASAARLIQKTCAPGI